MVTQSGAGTGALDPRVFSSATGYPGGCPRTGPRSLFTLRTTPIRRTSEQIPKPI